MTSFDITHFNSGTQKEADFLATFIARKDVLEFFLTQLRNTEFVQAARHHLIIAARGYGKTSLLRRIKIALRDEPQFNKRYIPLTFREEQHNVISLDVFWRNCLQSLLEAREDENAKETEIEIIDTLWQEHSPRSYLTREKQDGEPARMAFENHCRALNRRPVLLLDNLDLLLAGLVDEHQWTLRSILQHPEGPILIAAASRHPDCLSDQSAAFFDFFRIFNLKPLTNHEVMSCLRELANLRGEKGQHVLNLLQTDRGRISALNTMAGGNPRTLGVLYMVLEANMSDDLLTQLSSMLDVFTGWYQARTDELALQSRAVFDALALNWDPMSAAELSKITGLDISSIGSHLNRLEKSNHIEKVSYGKRKKRNKFQVAERFYNIWYLMRNGSRRTRQSIKFLTIFLRSCFSKRELNFMAKLKLKNGIGRVESTLALAATIANIKLRTRLLESAETSLSQFEKSDETYALIDEIRNEVETSSKKLLTFDVKEKFNHLLNTAKQDILNLNFLDAEKAYRQAIPLNEKDSLPWILLGDLLSDYLHDYDEAEKAYRQAISLNEKDSRPWILLGDLLSDHLSRYEEAELAYQKAISLNELNSRPWIALSFLYRDNLNSMDKAEKACRKAILLDDKDAFAWGVLGDLLIKLKRYDEAEVIYKKTIELNANDIRPLVALAHIYTTHNPKRYDEAEAAYKKAIEIDSNDHRPLVLFATLLTEIGRYEEAENTYRRAIELNGKNARPWGMLGDVLQASQRWSEAESAYKQAISLDENWNSPWIALGDLYTTRFNRLAEAQDAYNKAIELDKNDSRPWISLGKLYSDHLSRYEDAENAYYKAIELDETSNQPWIALALLYGDNLNRFEDSEKAFRNAIELDQNDARPWGMLGDLLQANLNRYDESEIAYKRAISLDEQWNSPWIALGDLYCDHLQRTKDAEKAYLRAIEIDKKDARPWISLGSLYSDHLHRYKDAEEAYLKGISLNENNANYWSLYSILLLELHRYEEAEKACRTAISLNEKSARYFTLLAFIQIELNRFEDAEKSYRIALQNDATWGYLWIEFGNLFRNHLHRYSDAEHAYRQAIKLNEKGSHVWVSLGNLLQDYLGNFNESLLIYEKGLEIHPDDTFLLTNTSYLYALHLNDVEKAEKFARTAEANLPEVAHLLLESMLLWCDDDLNKDEMAWEKLHAAISTNDKALWNNYIDDLQRILAYVIVNKDSQKLKLLMLNAEYPKEYASLYHAYCAAISGEDHLSEINPEVRVLAIEIYSGLSRLIRIFKKHRTY